MSIILDADISEADDANSSKTAMFEFWSENHEPSNTTLPLYFLSSGGSSLCFPGQSGSMRPKCIVFALESAAFCTPSYSMSDSEVQHVTSQSFFHSESSAA